MPGAREPAGGHHRLATQVGPLDAELLSTGGIMRCLIDRHNIGIRVFPYAAPDAQLPSGCH